MKLREHGTTSMLIVGGALLLLLPLLAILQYHWLSQLSARDQEHMKSNLRATAIRFSQDLDDELSRAFAETFPRRDAGTEDWLPAYAAQCNRWLAIAPYPKLIKGILVAQADASGGLRLQQLKTDLKQFVPCDWPEELSSIRTQLEQNMTGDQRSLFREGLSRRLRPIDDKTIVFHYPVFTPPIVNQRAPIAFSLPSEFVIVQLSVPEIQHEILPVLAKRHFSGADAFEYGATVVTQGTEQKVIYQFGPGAGQKTEADVEVGLLGIRPDMLRMMARRGSPGEAMAMRPPMPPPGNASGGPPRDRMGPPQFEERPWQLRLTHRSGSLEAAVTIIRRRNLMVSFGILALLAASVILMAQSARRAQRLARREMDFVAGVSHELRTPLAVIKSAAWSLTRGVIREEEQVKRYSALIGKESDRLIEMIEQVLEFAGARSGRQKLELQPASVSEVIDTVLNSSQPLLSEGNFQIEKDIASDLPQVMADSPALARALRNLIDNAMKYSGESRWIGVRAMATRNSRKGEVRITVSDHGIGISAEDLKHVFDPFWRAGEATAAQIHGNGLGLNLVKTIIKAHGGEISVQSAPGKGSSFTLILPAVAQMDAQPAAAASYLDTGATS
jgi:signal transduction histidine kinase